MRVRCSARADYRSNAVGSLELECTPEGLRIALCGVSSYREGYAPGLPVHASDVCVPWPSVYATRLGDQGLLLSVDAQQLPLNRFLLVELSEAGANAPAAVWSPRVVALGLIAVVAVGATLALSGALPHPAALGTVGMAAALVAALLGGLAVHASRTSKRTPEELLGELSHELARHLPNHMATEIPTPPPRSFEPRQLSALLPRSVVGIAITLAATTLAALVGSSAARPTSPAGAGEASAPEPTRNEPLASLPSPPDDRADGKPALPSDAPGAPEGRATVSLGAACECRQKSSLPSPLERTRLTPVVLARRSRIHEGHVHTELELAVVNDGNRDARDVSLSVVFLEQRTSPLAGQFQTAERPLQFEGPLLPGHLIKWHVEGRGTSFDVIAPDLGVLASDGSDAAPADALEALAASAERPLRLHATELLAFVGDERAQASALALQPATSDAEAAYLARLLEAPREVAACAVTGRREAGRWRFDACLFNRSAEARAKLAVRVFAWDGTLDPQRSARAPAVLAEHAMPLGLPLLAHSGRRLELSTPLPLEAGVTPRAFEIRVDREENLP
jgi:hypothetical protein